MRWLRSSCSLLLALTLALAGGATAQADTVTTDFESGPATGTPVTDQYAASGFVQFVAADPGLRPYRRDVGARARSGSTVVDVGSDVCPAEFGGGNSCEFATITSTGRLLRTASTVTLYAGLFTPFAGVGARLVALDAGGNVVATGATVPLPTSSGVAIDPGGGGVLAPSRRVASGPPHFTTPVTVTSASANIAAFRLEAVDAPAGTGAAVNATLGFDDLTLDYPANSLPDFSLSAPSLTSVLAGGTQDVPITVTRLNGSSGAITLSASGLPSGVSAAFTPNPLPAGQTAATMRLTGDPTAPRADNPVAVTVTADPQANANVGPAARVAQVLVRVGTPFELRAPGGLAADVGSCATTDVPIVVRRDGTFAGTVSLTPLAAPAGITLELAQPSVAPGGNLDAERTLRVSVAPGAVLPATVGVEATSPGTLTRRLTLTLRRDGEAHLAEPLRTYRAAQFMGGGSTAVVTGAGFCQGTQVQVGAATAPATIDVDGKRLSFAVPRTAASGTVRIVPPAGEGAPFTVVEPIVVQSFREQHAFAFRNYDYSALSYGELTDAFGDDDMWITVNPCWPWGSCRVNTGIPDPLSYAEWGILNLALRGSGGHCFGISRGVWQLMRGKVKYSRFAPGVTQAFDLPSAAGASSGLSSWLDGQHALQGSAEFLDAYAHRDRSVSGQLAALETELRAGRPVILTMHHDDGSVFGEGHAVLAYDMELVPGGTDVYVYDSNRPSAAGGTPAAAAASVVHLTQSNQRWEMTQASGDVWSGGGDGSFFVAPQAKIAENPSLPSLSSLADLPALLFGSQGAAATVTKVPSGATVVPTVDGGTPGSGGWVLGGASGPVDVAVTGQQGGSYSTLVSGPGFAGGVTDVPTTKGTVDAAGGDPKTGEVTFTSGQDRPLTLTVASGRGGSGARAARAADGSGGGVGATVSVRVRRGDEDAAALRGSTLTYAHDGKPTAFSFSMTTVSEDGGPQQFTSPTIPIRGGERATVVRASGATATVTLSGKRGTRRVTVRNRSRAAGRVRLGKLSAPKGRGARTVELTASIDRLPADASGALGVSLRLQRGAKTVGRTALSFPVSANGPVPVRWTIPASAGKGRLRLLVDARLAVGGAKAGTVKATRRTTITLR